MPPPLHGGRRRRDATAGAPPVGVWRGYSCTSSMNATKAPSGERHGLGAAAGPGASSITRLPCDLLATRRLRRRSRLGLMNDVAGAGALLAVVSRGTAGGQTEPSGPPA